MAEETVAEAPAPKRSVLPKLLALVVLMLVVAVVVNWKDISAIAAGRKTVKSVLYGKEYLSMEPAFRFPDPIGPEAAKVKVRVIAQEGNSCHEPLVALWMGIADLEPERLRVEFRRSAMQGPRAGGQIPELGCEAGVLINGENKFELGEGDSKRTLYLVKPGPQASDQLPGPDSADDPLAGEGWTLADLATIVNQAIEEGYGQESRLTADAIQEAWDAAVERIPRPGGTETTEGSSA
jgi:hypothetical protein